MTTTNTNQPAGETGELEPHGRLASAISRALQESADLEDEARQVAGHTEETGEVCTADCLACNDPVRAVIRDLRDARSEAFQRGRLNAALTDEVARLREVLEWQPIATVPKDGTEVLLAHGNSMWLDQWIADGNWDAGGYWMMCDQWTDPEIPTHWRRTGDLPCALQLGESEGKQEK